MMSVDRKEIDLIIRAALQGGKTLEGVTKSINDIEKALDAQAAAAKRGESSIDELKATLESLKRTQDELKDQAGLINQFDRLGKQIEKTSKRASEAAQNYSEYKTKIESAGEATDRQREKLIKLANAAERTQTTLSKQRADHEALATTLRESGIEMDKLGDAEARVRQSAAQLGLTIGKTQRAIATYAEDVRKARDADKQLAEQKAFDQKLADAAKLNKAGEYVRFWTEALNKADFAEQQVQINTALRKTADEAVAAARGYKTLGTAIKTISGPSSGLRDVINGILDPAAQARTTLAGVEEQIGKVATAATSARGPIEGYRGQIEQLVAAQKAIATQSSLVDQFAKQIVVLRQARTEYSTARAQVLQYAEALRTATGPNDQLQASLRNAQSTMAAARSNLSAQIGITREMRDSMRQAGLATNDLAATQGRLTSAAQSSVTALRSLEGAHKRYGDATRNAANANNFFHDSGRTTLSLVQRIRGEILSLVAAYVGIYGAINTANGAITAFNTKQSIQNQLALTTGNDNAKIAEEYQYIREQADRIGISFEAAAKGYAKFSASAKLAGRDTKEIRYIFETFSEVGRVAGLTSENMEGIFKALEQTMSKGTIQAEELRGQLGDRLFGAFQVAAQALKDQFPNLDKAMKDGQVTSNQLVKIAEKYKEIVGERLPAATNSLAANQDRLNSAIFDFKVMLAEKGFADEFAKLIERLTTFLQSEDGSKFAKSISDNLSMVAKALAVIVDNLDTVETVITIALGVYASKVVLGLGASAVEAAQGFKALGTAASGTGGIMAKLKATFFALNAFFIGWEVGTLLREKFVEVRLAGVALVVGLESLWVRLKAGTKIAFAEFPNIILDAFGSLGNGVANFWTWILGLMRDGAKALGKTDLAASIDKAMGSFQKWQYRTGTASQKIIEQMNADLAQIRKIGDEMADEAINPGKTTQKKRVVQATPNPNTVFTPTKKVDEKRIKLKGEIEAELAAINAKIERQEKDSLESRLKAIDDAYYRLFAKIKKLGGKEAEALGAQLTVSIGELKLQETKKFNDALLTEQSNIQKKLEQIDAQAGRKSKTDLQNRLSAVEETYAGHYRELADLRSKLVLNNRDTSDVDAMKSRLDAGVTALKLIETQKYHEATVNALLDERKAKLDVIVAQEKTGLLTAEQARQRAGDVVAETQPKIEAAVAVGLQFAEAMRESAVATGESTTSIDTFVAKLIEAQESAKGLRTEFMSAAQVNEMLAAGATSAFEGMANAIGSAVRGMTSWGQAIQSTAAAFGKFAADFLMQIGQMILKAIILRSLNSSFGFDAGGGISGLVNSIVGKFHDGGVVGSGGGRTIAPAAWFANAPRYHGGGIAGLAPDEYPAILKKNEEVLTQNDPRNVLNGGGASTAPSQNLKIVNMIDSGSVVSEGLSTQSGTKAFINFIGANSSEVKQILGVK